MRGRGGERAEPMRILLIDNHDSFTHNLRQLLGAGGAEVLVRRADAPESWREDAGIERLVLSPGPGHPDEAHGCRAAFELFRGVVPILAVCLGMQVVARVLGLEVTRGPAPVHGRASDADHDGQGLFRGLPNPVLVGRYHSLAVSPPIRLPAGWVASASARDDGVLLGLRHEGEAIEAVQFHPESVLTPEGPRMLESFLEGPAVRLPRR